MFPRSIEQRENMGTSFGNLRNPKQLGQQTLYESPSINCKSSKSTVFPHILHTRASVVPTTTLQVSFPPSHPFSSKSSFHDLLGLPRFSRQDAIQSSNFLVQRS